MSQPAPASESGTLSPLARAIIWSGLIAAVLDLGYVIVLTQMNGGDPVRMLQGIAAAAVGPAARNPQAWGYAFIGGALHFAVAYGWAALFCVVARARPYLLRQPGLAGPLYGALVWLVMQLVVLPFTQTPPKSFPPPRWEPVFLAHLLCVGLPIAVVARRFLAPGESSSAAPASSTTTE